MTKLLKFPSLEIPAKRRIVPREILSIVHISIGIVILFPMDILTPTNLVIPEEKTLHFGIHL